MDIQKVIKICKKCRQYIVIPGEKKVQWLGNDTAQYCISNHNYSLNIFFCILDK